MTRTLGYGTLIVYVAVAICVVAARPHWLSDANPFLRDFVGNGLLSLLGVILAITLASIASIHLEFNKIEERRQRRGLVASRQNIKKAAFWLIGLFAAGLVVVAVKPLASTSDTTAAVFNAAAILIVLWHVLILVTLTQMIFAIEPDIQG